MRRALLSLTPSAVLALATMTLGLTDNWRLAGVPIGDANFGDLNVIFVASQCASIDPSWSAASEPCLPGMSHYNYPSVWAKLLGIVDANPTWTPVVAALLMGAFIFSLIPLTWFALACKRKILALVGMSITAITPPILLAFQRGNIDLLMFAIITVAICLWIAQATKSAATAIGIAALLKIFPIGAALMLLSPHRPRRGALVALTVSVAIVIAVNFQDLALISDRTPQIDGASFGIGVLPLLSSNQLDLSWDPTTYRLLGLLIFAVGLAFAVAMLRIPPFRNQIRQLISTIAKDASASALILAGSGVFLISYLLGPSYDYRLIFLIPIIAGLLRVGSTLTVAIAGALILQMILSYSTYIGPIEYLSDVMWLSIAPLLAVGSFRILLHGRT